MKLAVEKSKIGMDKIGEFEHPKLSAGSPLLTHVLYKIEF